MKATLKLNGQLVAGLLAMACALPALSADAPPAKNDTAETKPAKNDAAETKPAGSSAATAEKKRTVTPHNHMRDAKGVWVPEKRPANTKKDQDNSAEKAPSDTPTQK